MWQKKMEKKWKNQKTAQQQRTTKNIKKSQKMENGESENVVISLVLGGRKYDYARHRRESIKNEIGGS